MSEVDNDETNRLKVGIGVFAAVTATAVFALVLFFFVRKLVQLFYIIKIICRIELFCQVTRLRSQQDVGVVSQDTDTGKFLFSDANGPYRPGMLRPLEVKNQ